MNELLNKLIELGLKEEEAKSLTDKAIKGYVLKEDYDVLKGEIKVHQDKATELSKTVKELQKEADNSEVLKLKLEDLQNNLASKDKEIEKVKFDFKLESKMK